MEELKILQKTFDMMNNAYPALAQYPKGEKFALVVEVEKLKAYVRLSYNLGFLPPKKYEQWSGLVVEIGRMVGGWIKSVSK